MGFTIIGAFKTWKKVEKEFLRPKFIGKLSCDLNKDAFEYTEMISDLFTFQGEFFIPNYDKEYFDFHKNSTNEFIEMIGNLKTTTLKKFLLQGHNKMIAYNYDSFLIAEELENYSKMYWQYSDEVIINLNKKSLLYAIWWAEKEFNIDLSQHNISYQNIIYYNENEDESTEIDEKINTDLQFSIEQLNKIIYGLPDEREEEDIPSQRELLEEVVRIWNNGGRIIYGFSD
jgi:hypothetical protein